MQSLKSYNKDVSHASLLDLLHRGSSEGKALRYDEDMQALAEQRHDGLGN